MNRIIPLALVLAALLLSGCAGGTYWRVDVYDPYPPVYHAPAPYYVVVEEYVHDGCCYRWIQREVQVFWHSGYGAWGYWGLDGSFIYYR